MSNAPADVDDGSEDVEDEKVSGENVRDEHAKDVDAKDVDEDTNRTARGPTPALLEALAPLLVWRIGRATDEGPVTVRVGLASAAGLFAALPRLKTVGDAELEAAAREGELRVEWVGHAPGGAGGV